MRGITQWRLHLLGSVSIGLAIAALAGCQGDPVECVIDSDCAEGQYCVATRCAEPVPEGDLRTAYQNQVAPLIETGCNCHGPGSGRPWSFEHRFDDPDAFDSDLAVLRQWLYDPEVAANPDFDRAASVNVAWGYGLATCGFNHPGIYGGPTAPQFTLLAAWAAEALPELPVIGTADQAIPEAEVDEDAPLPPLEAAALERILEADYQTGMAEEIVPRVVGQCGCCHALGGNRGFQLDNSRVLAGDALAAAIRSVEGLANRLRPDEAALLRYGLGANGVSEAHPIIYSSPADPRYRLLKAWMADGPAPP